MSARRFAVVGDPVAHSRSPAMHAAAYDALGLPHRYERVHASPAELARTVEELRRGAFDGLNLTVPHKEHGLALADDLDASARAIGAANTLVRTAEGRVVAHNTDAPALAAELRRLAAPGLAWTSGRALVLGSGGAAARGGRGPRRRSGVGDIAVRARAFEDAARRDRFVASAPGPVDPQPWRPSASSGVAHHRGDPGDERRHEGRGRG